MKTPKAPKIPTRLVAHNDERIDPYFWMKDKDSPHVLDYLLAENDYCNFQMQDTEMLQNELFEEMKCRYKKDEESIPYYMNGYWLYLRYEDDLEYPFFCRKKGSLSSVEEILLDVNLLAKDKEYYEVNQISISKNTILLGYCFDTTGDDVYSIKIKNTQTHVILHDLLENTTGKIVWADDNEHFFYVQLDAALRPNQIYLHKLGQSQDQDVLVYKEEDEKFNVDIFNTKSQEFIFIVSSSGTSDEHFYVPSNAIFSEWKLLQARTENLEYSVEHYKDNFYIITNDANATNFKIVKTPIHQPQKEYWEDLISHRDDVLIEGMELFEDYLVLEERKEGLLYIKILPWDGSVAYYLEFSEKTYNAYLGINLDFDTSILRFSYTSLTQPTCNYEFDMKTKTRVLVKQNQVLDPHFRQENYITDRVWVTAHDGKKIAISLVYHKDFPPQKTQALLLYAYGSYGISIDASFCSTRLSFLDRGFTYAIAHVRGGEYLGRNWYLDGKLLHKKNTFYDFISVAQFLIENRYTSAQHLYGIGGSAGGLLIAAVMNMCPKLFNGMIAEVPFVDVLTTMLDETLPLTIGEYEEWGDPNDPEYYDYIKSYSPYDNVGDFSYPHLLVSTALQDSHVPYWEPTKWVAKLRNHFPENRLLLLKTEMGTGHSGASGRFEALQEEAFQLAFLLKLENKQ